ncbi:RepB family plasmid replication initiator protein [Streptococcus orisratti]|uniref:RepB family plasmid replication initiator protein n=1 Tax=Streptococcus orisratti TaxID=114652 RepID=UPI0014613359|nr:RepB family plasmid replication initiator protein [Streptococcus orisratti]
MKETQKEICKLETKLTLQTEQDHPQIVGILNTPTLNQLFSIKRNQEPNEINKLLGNEARFELMSADENHPAVLFIGHYEQNKWIKLRTKKLLDFLAMRFSEKNSYKEKNSKINANVTFTLEEYAAILGKTHPSSTSTKKDVRRILKEALVTINSYSIETYEKRNAEVRYFSKMPISQDYSVDNGVYTVIFSDKFAEFLNTSYIMQFPLLLFSLDERGSNAYSIGRKLALHQSIKNNRKKRTSHIISVKSLLNVAPEIPSIDDVRKNNGSWSKRIEEPLTDALDKLVGQVNCKSKKVGIELLEYWEFCNSKGTSISNEQLADINYYIFSELYVKFSVKGID